MKGESDGGEGVEWRGEGMEGSDGGRGEVREGMVWCDVGLSFVEGGSWWVLLAGHCCPWVSFVSGEWSSAGGRCCPWAGGGCS